MYIDRQIDRRIDRQTDRQTDRQIDRCSYSTWRQFTFILWRLKLYRRNPEKNTLACCHKSSESIYFLMLVVRFWSHAPSISWLMNHGSQEILLMAQERRVTWTDGGIDGQIAGGNHPKRGQAATHVRFGHSYHMPGVSITVSSHVSYIIYLYIYLFLFFIYIHLYVICI